MDAEFVKSSAKVEECPPSNIPEYAFIGRSNVGKSSLINMLTGRKSLAKTSSTPGKTRLINHFLIDHSWYLVDLPGYGYAKVSKQERNKWKKVLSEYLKKRENMMGIFVLIDARIPPQNNDLEFMIFLGKNGIPFTMVFTKIDKISSSELNKNLTAYKKRMLLDWEDMPKHFITSSTSGVGQTELIEFIENTNKLY